MFEKLRKKVDETIENALSKECTHLWGVCNVEQNFRKLTTKTTYVCFKCQKKKQYILIKKGDDMKDITAKHTPTPWERGIIEGSVLDCNKYKIADCFMIDRPIFECEANARHIFKCVNMHDELINALESAYATINQLGYLSQDKLYKHDLENINNVLSKAKRGINEN